MKNFTLGLILLCVAVSLQAQIWEPHNAAFPAPSQGWRISPANDSVAWTFSFTFDSSGYWSQKNYAYSRTIDGGNTWVARTFTGILQEGILCNIFASGKDKAWISFYDYSEGGKIFHTIDGGLSWDQLNAPIQDVFPGVIYFFDNEQGIIWGDPIDGFYSIFTTSDGGLTWPQVSVENMPPAIDNDEWTISGNIGVNGDNVWFDTWYNRVFYSADRGHTWTVWESPVTTGYGLDLMADRDDNLYYIQIIQPVSGSNDEDYGFEIFRRHPNDSDWTDITPAENSKYISGFSPVPGTNTLIMNVIDETRISYDHGESWTTIDIDTTFRRGYASFVNDQIGYCCQMPEGFENPSQNVYKYIGSPLSGLLHPQLLDVTLDLSPNPASDRVVINMAGDRSEDYWILVNDLNGKLMYKAEVTNETAFSKTIDVGSYMKGMYTITVSNKHGLRTETFLKM